MAEYDERYEGNGDHAAAPAGGSPPAGAKPSRFSDHADGRSAQPQDTHKEAMETLSQEGDGEHKDGSTIGVDMASNGTFIKEHISKTEDATSDPARIIYPDPLTKSVNSAFYSICELLLPILEKDDVQQFLCFFQKAYGVMVWEFITPETLLNIILEDSVQCAKVVLEGEAPELMGHRAYPNCASQYGFFPIHLAAEMFSVDMIKVLLQHGASANVRTYGSKVIVGLLPLHVAVENTCMHKYLDDNLFTYNMDPRYFMADTNDVYKLIHLLCLPEMKIFLDTTRLLAEHTNDLLGEICNYIRCGKLVQTAVLLLAAQKHIRGSCSCKKKGNIKPDGFSYIIRYIVQHTSAINLEIDQNGPEDQELKKKYISSMVWLVEAISVAGESLDAYIRDHSKVPHKEVLERVSSILNSYGFCPTGKGISIEALLLSPYKVPLPDGLKPDEHGYGLVNKIAKEDPHSRAGKKKNVEKKTPITRGWDLKYRRRSFFPYWRSALAMRFPVRIYPSYSISDKHHRDLKAIIESNWAKERSTTPDHNSGLLASVQQSRSTYQLKRTFGTAAFPCNCQATKLFGTNALTSNHQLTRLFGTTALTSNHELKQQFGTAILTLLKALKKA